MLVANTEERIRPGSWRIREEPAQRGDEVIAEFRGRGIRTTTKGTTAVRTPGTAKKESR